MVQHLADLVADDDGASSSGSGGGGSGGREPRALRGAVAEEAGVWVSAVGCLVDVITATLAVGAVIRKVQKDLEQRSVDGTIKYRWRTHDGKLIESVYMPSEARKTLCVSTQVGCAMGCTFCATGTLGLKRNLTPSEIVAQVHAVNREVRKNEGLEQLRPLTNLVFMGMGEPLHNFENLKVALEILKSEDGPNFSHRHITVSTVGLVPMIERFGAETDVKLAISLNATTDEQRSQVMPAIEFIARRISLNTSFGPL